MEKRKLGNSDLNLSVIGLGTWAIGGSWEYGWGAQDESESIDCIHEALDHGINWIDTAPAYGWGKSEEIVGKALKGKQQNVYIATKCSLVPDKNGNKTSSLKRSSIFAEIEKSLRLLQVDVIDLYQIHWPNPSSDIEEGFQALLDLKAAGKIRYAAVSNFSREQLVIISKLGEVTSLQSPYSLLNRGVEIDILPWCIKNNCGFLAYSPMQCGLLTGKVTPEWIDSLPSDDWRKTKSKYFQEPILSKTLQWLEDLKQSSILNSYASERQLSGLAINWVLSHSGVTSAIVGARKRGQISDSLRALEWKLQKEDLEMIEVSYKKYFDRFM